MNDSTPKADTLITECKRTRSTTLDLGYCGLKVIPQTVLECTWLHILILNHNNISNIEELDRLSNLQDLYLGFTQIRNIEVVSKLSNLQDLDLSSTQIRNIEVLGKLNNLQTLFLRSTQISNIEVLGKLSNLQTLYLSSTQINNIEIIGKLSNLQTLHLSDTKISDIEVLGKLSNLQNLYLSDTKISNIEILGKLSNLQNLDLSYTPFTQENPTIARSGTRAILDYLRNLAENKFDSLQEAKLIIVGLPRAGKTTLARKIINLDAEFPEEDETSRNIEVMPHYFKYGENKDFRMNIWDFGGHQIYHATHQFFLTEKAVYVVLSSTREGEEDFDYWLQIVDLFSKKSPMVLVQNIHQNRTVEIRSKDIMKFAGFNVEAILEMDFKNEPEKIAKLIDLLKNRLTELPHISSKVPKTWVAIRKELEEMTNSEYNRNLGKTNLKDTITVNEYVQVCAKYEMDRETALAVGRVFHEIGVFLHFQDELELENLIILNKLWATDAVYRIIDDTQIRKAQNGSFSSQDLKRLWKEDAYCEKRRDLLALMKKFELCYQVGDKNEFIVPQMKSIETPKTLPKVPQNEQVLSVIYEYKFMPKGIAPRLAVRLHELILNQAWVWAEGVVFSEWNTQAIVEAPYLSRSIVLKAWGLKARDLITKVCYELEKIHATFPNLAYGKKIACNCPKCSQNIAPFMYDYDMLQRRVKDGKLTKECDFSYEKVDIRTLLDNTFSRKIWEEDAEMEMRFGEREKRKKSSEEYLPSPISKDSSAHEQPIIAEKKKWWQKWW